MALTIIRIRFWGPLLYYYYNQEPPKIVLGPRSRLKVGRGRISRGFRQVQQSEVQGTEVLGGSWDLVSKVISTLIGVISSSK